MMIWEKRTLRKVDLENNEKAIQTHQVYDVCV